jgi:hypothetical protein
MASQIIVLSQSLLQALLSVQEEPSLDLWNQGLGIPWMSRRARPASIPISAQIERHQLCNRLISRDAVLALSIMPDDGKPDFWPPPLPDDKTLELLDALEAVVCASASFTAHQVLRFAHAFNEARSLPAIGPENMQNPEPRRWPAPKAEYARVVGDAMRTDQLVRRDATRRPQQQSRQMHSFVVRSRKVGSTVVPLSMPCPHNHFSSRFGPNVECGGLGGSFTRRHLESRSAFTISSARISGRNRLNFGPRCMRSSRLIVHAIVHSGLSGSMLHLRTNHEQKAIDDGLKAGCPLASLRFPQRP